MLNLFRNKYWLPLPLLLALTACGGGGDETELPTPTPTPTPPLTAADGLLPVPEHTASYIDLQPYVQAGAGSNVRVTKVQLSQPEAHCGTPQVQGIGFNVQLSGSGLCEYHYTVESTVQGAAAGTQSTATAKMLLLAGVSSDVLPPLPLALVQGQTATVDLAAELGADFPPGYSLNADISLLGSGVATADTANNSIGFEALATGLSRVVYRLDGSSGEFKLGTIDIAVSDSSNRPPVATSFQYSALVYVGDNIEIDVAAYISDPDAGQTVQLITVDSFDATVALVDPDDISNTRFSFRTSEAGLHYVAWQVTDQHGGFASAIVKVDVIEPLAAVNLWLSPQGTRRMKLFWTPSGPRGVEYTLCRRDAAAVDECEPLGSVIDQTEFELLWPSLLDLSDISYFIRARRGAEVQYSNDTNLRPEHVTAMIGYFKASNSDAEDLFGSAVAQSGDGNTLAVGAYYEASNATGIDGDQADNSASYAGAVYLYRFSAGRWTQQAYIKASNAESMDHFGYSVALSSDGNTLAVGAMYEHSGATGVYGNQNDNSRPGAGAVYLYRFSAGGWTQQAYVKATNTDNGDGFGEALALSGDGNTLAASTGWEGSASTGIDGDQSDNSAHASGVVYLYRFAGGLWSPQAYIKASNTGPGDRFGTSIALSSDGNTLAVGAPYEDSSATGIDGDQADNSALDAGAVYLYRFSGGVWAQQAYIKASNTDAGDAFGTSVALSGDGDTLAVGARGEDSAASGIDGDQSSNTAADAGAVYLFRFAAGTWAPRTYIKASNPGAGYNFGTSVALTPDGNTLAVGASLEGSPGTGIDGDQANNSATWAGAAYLYRFNAGVWGQHAYIKASNTDANDRFGVSVALSDDGTSLMVGAGGESSLATGIDGDKEDNSALRAGAVYLY